MALLKASLSALPRAGPLLANAEPLANHIACSRYGVQLDGAKKSGRKPSGYESIAMLLTDFVVRLSSMMFAAFVLVDATLHSVQYIS